MAENDDIIVRGGGGGQRVIVIIIDGFDSGHPLRGKYGWVGIMLNMDSLKLIKVEKKYTLVNRTVEKKLFN